MIARFFDKLVDVFGRIARPLAWTTRDLRSKDIFVRSRAVSKLAELRDPRSAEALMSYIREADERESEYVIAEAMRTLVSFSPPNRTPFFRDLLTHPSTPVVGAAIGILADTNDAESANRLRTLLSHPSEEIRRSAAEMLAYKLAWKPSTPGERALLGMALGHFEKIYPYYVLNEGDAAVEPLIIALNGFGAGKDHWRTPAEAATALGEIGGPRAISALLAKLGRHQNVQVRAASVRALGKIANPTCAEALSVLLNESELYLLSEVVKALTNLGHPSVLAWARAQIERGSGPTELQLAMDVLIELRSPDGFRLVERYLRDYKTSTRKPWFNRAARAAGASGDQKAVPLLLEIFAHDYKILSDFGPTSHLGDGLKSCAAALEQLLGRRYEWPELMNMWAAHGHRTRT